ncbi:DUF4349 domain-containing protein [uncultured Oscillibacter sp.]|uniref:DUF4349 domain-containing protein n=1 Tax=uncultured Oscillibacter sp. TaxID=876091 RepID=UPI0025E3E7DE|nr:DUF4349 domain-containing protein [uncultured Oscillibacter sp.]
MKKKGFVWVLMLVLATGLLSGCGSESAASMPQETAAAEAPAESYSMDASADYGTGNGSMMPAAEGSGEESNAVQGSKRIYTASLELETTGFDEAVSSLTELVDSCGGWISSSSVSNHSSSYRYADLTVRVPVEKYRDFLTQAGELCHLLYTQEYVDDVTESYYDTAGRLETQRIKLERLQSLMAQAENMADIITIESAISETEQMIDSLSGTLQHYDAQVDYATVTISLQEVGKLSNVEEPTATLGGRLAAALASGGRGFLHFAEDLLVILAYGWVWLVILAVAAIVVVRRLKKKGVQLPFLERKNHTSGHDVPKDGTL